MTKLPTQASVVVIGGGVMGCSTLYHLAKAGISDAVLIERNKLTSGTTWHSAAQVRALRSSRNMTELIRYSVSLYSELEAETGQATGWINKGSLSIATTPDRLIHIKRQEALARSFGVRAETISAGEASERWPLMNAEDVLGAVWSPDDGRVSPSDLCAALAKGAKSRGAQIFEDTAVVGIETRDGRITGVRTSAGDIRCDAIALCAGLWSREVGAMAGAEVPLWPCEHFYLLTKPVDGIVGNMPSLSDHDAHLYIRDDSGGLLVGCFEPLGKPIDPATLGPNFAFQLLPEDWDHFEPMMVNAMHRLPILETAEVKMLLNGPESFTPDGSFMLGETAEAQGLFLGCGMNSVGVATGGGAGMALAHTIVHGQPPFDLHEVDPQRFAPEFNTVDALTVRAPEILGTHYEITYPGRQRTSARGLRPTPLDDAWTFEGALFGQVGAWERPLYFNAKAIPTATFGKPDWFDHVGREVMAAHTQAAVFDQSTFGKISVEGPDAEVFLDRVCANTMKREPGRVIYTGMLNDQGGYQSDLTALRLGDESYRLYVGTTAIKRDLAWLKRHLRENERVTVTDETADFAVLGLMGPNVSQIVGDLGAETLNDLPFFHHQIAEISGIAVRAARLSYVGEPGWELTCRVSDASSLYKVLKDAGASPAGLYAQTSMRIEKRFLAMGHELDSDVSPLEAGLTFTVDWHSDFIGRDALQKRCETDVKKHIVTLLFENAEAVPLGSEPVMVGTDIVGQTTSAGFGYRVGQPVALAYVDAEIVMGKKVLVDVGRVMFAATVSTGAAYS